MPNLLKSNHIIIPFKHAFVILFTVGYFSGADHTCLLGEWRIPGNLVFKIILSVIYHLNC